MGAYRDRRDGRWRWRVTVHLPDGSRRRISGTPDLDTRIEAERCERDAIARELHRARFPEAHRPRFTMSEVADRWFAERAATVRSSTIAIYRKGWDRIRKHLHGRHLASLSRADIDQIRADFALDGYSPATQAAALAVLRMVLRFAETRGLIERAPQVPYPTVLPRTDWLQVDEYEALIAAAPPPWDLVLLLGGDSGLRVGEIRGLRWEDRINAPGPALLIRRQRTDEGDVDTKTGRQRIVPTTPRLTARLDAEARSHQRVIPYPTSFGGWFRRLGQAKELAGLERPVTYHILRHTFASRLAQLGINDSRIAALLGHTTTRHTRVYVHLSVQSLADAVRLLDGPGLATTRQLVDASTHQEHTREDETPQASAAGQQALGFPRRG